MDIKQKKGSSFGWSEEAISLAKQARIGSADLRLEERARTASGSRIRHSLHTSLSLHS